MNAVNINHHYSIKHYLFFLLCINNFCYAQECLETSIQKNEINKRLIDNKNGTITDSNTLLMWGKCSYGQTGNNCSEGNAMRFDWRQSLNVVSEANNNNFLGFNDWRLPNIKELLSITNLRCAFPSISDEKFPNTQNDDYWSSSSSPVYNDYAYSVNFSGSIYPGGMLKNTKSYVRLVRN